MANEIETKVLDIDSAEVLQRLKELGATKVLDTRLVVNWYRPVDVKPGEDLWYLRIRTDASGKAEITWKGKSTTLGVSHSRREINLGIDDAILGDELLEAMGLARYAHQEKDRQSFTLNDWRFDLDQYPHMPPYLEIEGSTEASIKVALTKLNLTSNRTWVDGERTLIETVYNLNWHDMAFDKL